MFIYHRVISINSAIQGTSRCIWPGSPPSLAHLVRWAATALLCPRWSPRNWGKDRTRHHLRWGGVGFAWKHRAGKLENPKKSHGLSVYHDLLSWFIVVYHHFHSFPALTPLFSGGNSYFQTHILFAGCPVMMLPSTPSWPSATAWGPGCSSWAAANLQTRPRESS